MASIERRIGKDGTSYKITVSVGRDITGKQKRHYKTWKPEPGLSARQIEKKVKQVAVEFEKEIEYGFQADNRQTFAEYAESVLDMREREQGQTVRPYRRCLKRLIPLLGDKKIRDIRPQHIRAVYAELSKPGERLNWGKAVPLVDFKKIARANGGQEALAFACDLSTRTMNEIYHGRHISYASAVKIAEALKKPITALFDIDKQDDGVLKGSTLQTYHCFLRMVFKQAENDMLVTINPMERVKTPHADPPKQDYFQPDEIRRILEAAEQEPIMWRTMVHLFVVSGARRGEILALKWENVDFSAKEILLDSSISYIPGHGLHDGPTKTRKARYIPLPAETFTRLNQYRRWQLERRLLYGDQWKESPYVFTGEHGGAIYPTTVNAWLRRFSDRRGLPYIHPHSFRHTAASIMISRGVDIVSVSKMLGHATTTTTMDVYAHAIEETKRSAAECIADTILRKKA